LNPLAARNRIVMSAPRKVLGSGTTAHPTLLTWCAVRRAGVLLVLAFVGLTAIWTGVGLLITGPLAGGLLGKADQDAARWLVEHRTPALDVWSGYGAMPAETMVKVVATAIIAAAMFIAWRSWREPALVCFSLILEAAVFITVTAIVGRPRPDVSRLDEVSVDTSFPSGHAAAAAAYSAIAIVVFERTRNVWIRAVTVLLAVAVPVIVAVSRMYRGVHYLTDVVGGILLGPVCVAAVYFIIRRCFERPAVQRGSALTGPG
jgi:membrane-associated phospholipid phosphatase